MQWTLIDRPPALSDLSEMCDFSLWFPPWFQTWSKPSIHQTEYTELLCGGQAVNTPQWQSFPVEAKRRNDGQKATWWESPVEGGDPRTWLSSKVKKLLDTDQESLTSFISSDEKLVTQNNMQVVSAPNINYSWTCCHGWQKDLTHVFDGELALLSNKMNGTQNSCYFPYFIVA